MKIIKQFLFVIFSLILLSSNCKKDNQTPQSELSKLPPITQIGANTFGCLVNGIAFTPQNQSILEGPQIQCNYIFTSGGYHFTVAVSNKTSAAINTVIVGTDSLAITQGQTLIFKTFTAGNADASYLSVSNNGTINQYFTNNVISGQLTISKLDQTNQIVSGTFYFNAVNSIGDMVSITDGRFDMPYTQ